MPNRTLPLFRLRAVEARRPRAYGRTILVRPLSFSFMTAGAVAVGGAICAFAILGTYTRHAALAGQLVPDRGLIKVYAQQVGTIVEKRVAEGTAVAQDDVLFAISSERFSSARGATERSVGEQLDLEERSLREQMARTRQLEATEQESLERMINALTPEESKLESMIESQRERLVLAADATARYAKIAAEGFLPEDNVMSQRGNELDQRARLQSLEKDLTTVRRQLTDFRNQTLTLPLKYENQLAEFGRALSSILNERTQNEVRRLVLIRAPQSGVVTAVVSEVGQVVDSSRPLLSIVPDGSTLEAHFFAPSRDVGFIEVGDRVLLRYDAYPYQRFGHHDGKVKEVSRTAVSAAELLGYVPSGPDQPTEPLYRVKVVLAAQTITAYGKQQQLQPGMLVEADVMQDTRRLYEWVLEPLYALSGRIH